MEWHTTNIDYVEAIIWILESLLKRRITGIHTVVMFLKAFLKENNYTMIYQLVFIIFNFIMGFTYKYNNETAFKYILLLYIFGATMYHCIQLKNFLSDNDSASTQKLYSKAETTKQKLKQLDLQSLQKKLNLRNEKMEMLVNELKKQKANIKQMEYDRNIVNAKYESDIKRLKDELRSSKMALNEKKEQIQVLKTSLEEERTQFAT